MTSQPATLQLTPNQRLDCAAIVRVLLSTGKTIGKYERIVALSELLDEISGAVGNGYMPGLLRFLRLRVLHKISKLDDATQKRLIESLSQSAMVAGAFDHGFPDSSALDDSSGGDLRPIPLSIALRDALTSDAQAHHREPHLHALVILNHHYGLGPGIEALDPNPEAIRRTRAALEPKGGGL
jgi:hypothetical protein